jgi:hypothetical protein
MVKLSRTIRLHRRGITRAVELGLSNSKLEGLASKVRLINHRGYGHHSAAAVISTIDVLRRHHGHAAHRKVRRNQFSGDVDTCPLSAVFQTPEGARRDTKAFNDPPRGVLTFGKSASSSPHVRRGRACRRSAPARVADRAEGSR